jgi:hypothetical protein
MSKATQAALLDAAEGGRLDECRKLVEEGADVNGILVRAETLWNMLAHFFFLAFFNNYVNA